LTLLWAPLYFYWRMQEGVWNTGSHQSHAFVFLICSCLTGKSTQQRGT
jgi:hypothetical protein